MQSCNHFSGETMRPPQTGGSGHRVKLAGLVMAPLRHVGRPRTTLRLKYCGSPVSGSPGPLLMQSKTSSLICIRGRLSDISHSRPIRKVLGFGRWALARRMERREFITLLGGAAAALPLAARAQQPAARVHRIGYLAIASPEQQVHLSRAFEGGLRSLGYRIGENVVIEYRYAYGQL